MEELIRLSKKHITVLHLQMFKTQTNILFTISATGLFLKYSNNFANFSLDILIRYILIKRKKCRIVSRLLHMKVKKHFSWTSIKRPVINVPKLLSVKYCKVVIHKLPLFWKRQCQVRVWNRKWLSWSGIMFTQKLTRWWKIFKVHQPLYCDRPTPILGVHPRDQ